jgi:hypothetical protein
MRDDSIIDPERCGQDVGGWSSRKSRNIENRELKGARFLLWQLSLFCLRVKSDSKFDDSANDEARDLARRLTISI